MHHIVLPGLFVHSVLVVLFLLSWSRALLPLSAQACTVFDLKPMPMWPEVSQSRAVTLNNNRLTSRNSKYQFHYPR
jgi:hypothetical protein